MHYTVPVMANIMFHGYQREIACCLSKPNKFALENLIAQELVKSYAESAVQHKHAGRAQTCCKTSAPSFVLCLCRHSITYDDRACMVE